ncbi:MAG: dihydrofolate reductase family protein [Cyanobacteria bacterium J06650_10]
MTPRIILHNAVSVDGRVDWFPADIDLFYKLAGGIKKVQVDSGGTLNGVLLRQELVDEINLLIHPYLVGRTTTRSIFRGPDLIDSASVIQLKLVRCPLTQI